MSRIVDAMIGIGLLLIAVGLWMTSPSLALVVIGTILFVAGGWLALRRARAIKPESENSQT